MTRRPFMLVDLLLLIAVTAVLAGLLLSALNRMRNVAQEVLCLGNKKDCIKGMAAYGNDNDGMFVILQKNQFAESNRWGWNYYLGCGKGRQDFRRGKYIDFSSTRCPLMKKRTDNNFHLDSFGMDSTCHVAESMVGPRALLGLYWVGEVGRDNRYMDSRKMKTPEVTAVFADTVRADHPGKYMSINIFHQTDAEKWSKMKIAPFMGHSRKNPVAFADGHAAMRSGDELYNSPYWLKVWTENATGTELVER